MLGSNIGWGGSAGTIGWPVLGSNLGIMSAVCVGYRLVGVGPGSEDDTISTPLPFFFAAFASAAALFASAAVLFASSASAFFLAAASAFAAFAASFSAR